MHFSRVILYGIDRSNHPVRKISHMITEIKHKAKLPVEHIMSLVVENIVSVSSSCIIRSRLL